MCFPQWQSISHPVIGMLHLLPLPGSPAYGGDVKEIERSILQDAEVLVSGGVNGLLLENFGDAPFYPGRVPAHTVSHMTSLAKTVRGLFANLPIGINVLRNDAISALSIAHAVGAQFIRVNVLVGARVTDQGIIQSEAHELMRERTRLGAENIKVFADVDVKHSAPLAPQTIDVEIDDLIHRARADGLIVSGSATGRPTDVAVLATAKQHAQTKPVFVGSGITPENVQELSSVADGFIVGTSLKNDGVPTAPVDPQRVAKLMQAVSSAK